MLTVERIEMERPIGVWLQERSVATRAFLYSSLMLAIILFGVFATNPFIYFQF